MKNKKKGKLLNVTVPNFLYSNTYIFSTLLLLLSFLFLLLFLFLFSYSSRQLGFSSYCDQQSHTISIQKIMSHIQ